MKKTAPRRPRGRARVFAFALGVVALAAGSAGASPTTTGCASTSNVPGLGQACRDGNLWKVPLKDGTVLLTHGQDDVIPRHPLAGSGGQMPSCATDSTTQPYNVVIYAHASDKANLYTAHLATLRAMVAEANAALRAEAALFSRTMDFRFLCANGLVVVNDAPLLVPDKSVTLDTLVTSLRALGFTSTLAKYWVWYDGQPPNTQAGVGTLENDDALSATNANNFGPSYGVTWGLGADQRHDGAAIMMHEAAHTLGAVQNSAPHATGAGHCTDGLDLMCYADGGPSAGNYNERACSVMRFDCNHDDYFNPVPSGTSYLAKHWNLASPLNRFVAGCYYGTGMFPNATALSITIPFPATCQGRPFALSAIIPQPVGVTPIVASELASIPAPDVNVCWFAGAVQISCNDNVGAESGTVPSSATSAHVSLATGPLAAYVLSAI